MSSSGLIRAETLAFQEKKTGFVLSSVTGRFKDGELVVKGEVRMAEEEAAPKADLHVKMIAYSDEGEIVATDYTYVEVNENIVLEVFEAKLKCEVAPARIMAYPFFFP